MGKSTYLGGHTIVTASGYGWSYDPLEVRDEVVQTKRPKTPSENAVNAEKPKSPSKSKKQIAEEKARFKARELRQYAARCALADKHGKPRPQRPATVKKSWVKHEKQKAKFEMLVQEVLSRMS